MRVAVGADHAGFRLKTALVEILGELGHEVEDVGTFSEDSVNYADYSVMVAEKVARGECERGVIVCGTGIGPCIAANKLPGIRAAVLSEPYSARMSRAHNDANVLCLGSRVIGIDVARDCLLTFLRTPFEGGRHAQRLERIAELDAKRR
jgi:ribose 5-phosphate isomerase B